MSFCISVPNFVKIGPFVTELWRHSDFQDGGRRPYWICSRVVIDHPRSDIRDPSSLVKFGGDRIYNFGDIAIFIFCRSGLKWSIHVHFQGVLGPISSQMTSLMVLTPKRHLLARKHVVWATKCENPCSGSTWARARGKQELSYRRVSARCVWTI